jgi:Tfp pilus assembly protein PilO
MSRSPHGTTLTRRILAEHRVAVLLLLGLLVTNGLVYALVVSPLAQRVATVEERTRAANLALDAARRADTQANEALAARARATERLQTFQASVLPADLVAARQLVDPRLYQMGQRMGLLVRNVSFDLVPPREDGLTRLHIGMDLAGSYADARAFIRQIESAPEFVIIDDVRLQEGAGEGTALQLRIDLSTYYRSVAR